MNSDHGNRHTCLLSMPCLHPNHNPETGAVKQAVAVAPHPPLSLITVLLSVPFPHPTAPWERKRRITPTVFGEQVQALKQAVAVVPRQPLSLLSIATAIGLLPSLSKPPTE